MTSSTNPGTELEWRESYFCTLIDLMSDRCAVTQQGSKQDSGHGESNFILCDRPDEIIRYVDPRQPLAPSTRPGCEMHWQLFKCLEPWQRWNVEFRRPNVTPELHHGQLSDTSGWGAEDLELAWARRDHGPVHCLPMHGHAFCR